MANPEHVAKLLEGVAAWNAWRQANPEMEPDLDGVIVNVEAVWGTPLLQIEPGTGKTSVNLCGINFQRTNLNKAILTDVNIQGGEFQGASLDDANLRGAHLVNSIFIATSLCRTDLQDCHLWYADFRGASLLATDLSRSDLWCADFRGACLSNANLESANVAEIHFDYSSLQLNYQGIRVSTCYGNQMFKSFAQDQDYIEGLRAGRWGRVKFWPWWLFADCGRSFLLWACWSLGLATLFGYLYYYWLGPSHFKLDHLTFDLFAMIYYSIVTFTTLGFGDIKPSTPAGAGAVMLEVILGYIMLGGLIAILANKVARRS